MTQGIVITGASGGLGEATVRHLAQRGLERHCRGAAYMKEQKAGHVINVSSWPAIRFTSEQIEFVDTESKRSAVGGIIGKGIYDRNVVAG
jgi:nucleoside-diphosphate-sugar epimerase